MRKDTLNMPARPALASVAPAIPVGELDVMSALLQDTVLDAVFAHPGLVGFGVVCFVPVDFFGVSRRNAFENVCLLSMGSGRYGGTD